MLRALVLTIHLRGGGKERRSVETQAVTSVWMEVRHDLDLGK